MAKRNWQSMSPDLILERIKQAGISESNYISLSKEEPLDNLDTRIDFLLSVTKNNNKKHMVFFVMYDIENNKVRTLISKYLIAQGCTRIQNSIFLADTSKERMDAIVKDLTSVQETYENNDSIIVSPMSYVNFESMHIIGKQINMELIKKEKKMILI